MPSIGKEKHAQICALLAKRKCTRVKNLRKNKTLKNKPHRSKRSWIYKDWSLDKWDESKRKTKEKYKKRYAPKYGHQFVTPNKSLLPTRVISLDLWRKLETSKIIELTLSLSWTCLNYKNCSLCMSLLTISQNARWRSLVVIGCSHWMLDKTCKHQP